MFRFRAAAMLVLLGACASQNSAHRKGVAGGTLLRFRAQPGQRLTGKSTLSIEAETKNERAAFGFTFTVEETVEAVDQEGTASVSARLLDATGRAGPATDQKTMDDLALAFDELKIHFKRSARGEVTDLAISDVRRPLDEKMARTVVNNVFGASRGPLLPDETVDVGSTWRVETDVGTAVGVIGRASHSYLYARKKGNLAVISCESALDAKSPSGARQHMSSKSTGEYAFDVESARLQSVIADASIRAEEDGTPSVRQRITLKWTAE